MRQAPHTQRRVERRFSLTLASPSLPRSRGVSPCLQSAPMLATLRAVFIPEALQRLTLLINHVLSGEPVASQRLLPHVGKRLQVELVGWPSLLPAPPLVAFRVTPAGLLEWCDDAGAPSDTPAELHLSVAAANPALLLAQLAAGERPEVGIQGEAQFAADVHWLADNLRWDLEADLARVAGPGTARQLTSLGAALAAGLRRWAAPSAKL